MFEFISQHPKIAMAILSPMLLVAGYFYRSRKEKRGKLSVALFTLLQIWHKLSVFYRKDFDGIFDTLINELIKVIPEEEFTEEQRAATKEYFVPIFQQSAKTDALSGFDIYAESFDSVINIISTDDPFFAYKISSSGKVKSYLSWLDSYLATVMKPLDDEGGDSGLLAQTVKSHVTSHAASDTLNELEGAIKELSLKIGIFTYFQACKTIRKRRKQLNEFSQTEARDIIEKVLLPAMNEFKKSSKRDPVTGAPF
ncbi:hypothetical protein KO528_00015 [Saccharophagus degradans]|uniref:hypothetical protein n=1 Tax=Saccharophagus degradans TaxID=86304 RepID=UPI001C098616|nr:hypothetical protein [Saccharophagus degradans]MBU2983719.1 hypothetical protein [Saccharophagus degradans]